MRVIAGCLMVAVFLLMIVVMLFLLTIVFFLMVVKIVDHLFLMVLQVDEVLGLTGGVFLFIFFEITILNELIKNITLVKRTSQIHVLQVLDGIQDALPVDPQEALLLVVQHQEVFFIKDLVYDVLDVLDFEKCKYYPPEAELVRRQLLAVLSVIVFHKFDRVELVAKVLADERPPVLVLQNGCILNFLCLIDESGLFYLVFLVVRIFIFVLKLMIFVT